MPLTEPTLAPQVDAPAPVEPPAVDWLPLTTGDRERAGDAPAEHGWPASLFIFLSNMAALGSGLGTLVVGGIMVAGLSSGEWQHLDRLPMTLSLAAGCVMQRALAVHVKRFTRWGWYGVMAELAFLTLSKASVMVTEPAAIPGAVVGIGVDLLWMRYFWNRRADFDVDLGG